MTVLPAGVTELYTAGWSLVLDPQAILLIAAGVLIGLFVGAMPGLTANMGVAVLVPLTFTLPPAAGISALAGIWLGALYGGTIPAVLINMPGTPGDIMTTADGYPMSKRGEGGRAIGIGILSSFSGGMISVLVLATASPLVANVARNFGSAEYFAVAFLGLAVIAAVSGSSLLKGLASALVGLFVGAIGIDLLSGQPRFTFGQAELQGGVNFVAVVIGIFGLAEVLEQVYRRFHLSAARPQPVRKITAAVKDMLPLRWVVARSSVIGVFVGAIPGAGATIASIIAYGAQKSLSKRPDLLGKGSPEGVCASDTANNACTGGALITMLSIGIPGDAVTAVLLGALVIQGIQPGPLLFQNNIDVVSAIFISLVIANIFLLIFGLLAARHFAKILAVPRPVLLPMIVVLCVVGTYALNNVLFDVWVMLFFGLLGFLLSRFGVPKAPLILALILGPILEENLRRVLQLTGGDYWESTGRLFGSPIALPVMLAALAMLALPLIPGLKRVGRLPGEESDPTEQVDVTNRGA